MKIANAPGGQQVEEVGQSYDVSRRRFFQLAGGIAGAGLLLSACKRTGATDVFIGDGDIALLNYLYILQQLEVDFYKQAVATYYANISNSELLLLTDVRDQEIVHKEFFKFQLGQSAIPDIKPNFSSVTFADRTSTLSFAAKLEDLVISGFNGAVHLFSNKNYALAVSKMVTVEARHSAYFRDALNFNTFGDSTAIGSNGLDRSGTPSAVLAAAEAYILTRFDSTKLPN